MRPYGLSVFSFPFTAGYAKREGKAIDTPLGGHGLIELAAANGLNSVEMPLAHMLPDTRPETIDRFGAACRARKLDYVLDTGVLDVATLREALPQGVRAGAKIVRAMLSGFLEGARAVHAPDWNGHMRDALAKLFAIYPLLEEHNLTLAMENHQDATSDDLLALCSVGPRIAVTFDVVNPLAVGEDCFLFAKKLMPHIVNVHIKDYTIHPSASGYYLARAALGEGVIDWQRMVSLIRTGAPAAVFHVELAAINARHIRLLEDDWWPGYPPRDARALLPALRFAAQHAQPSDAPWQTPWERGDAFSECERYERGQLTRSLAHLDTIDWH